MGWGDGVCQRKVKGRKTNEGVTVGWVDMTGIYSRCIRCINMLGVSIC